MKVTILMPCLNESKTIGTCISKALNWCRSSGCEYEILVADNGSTDGSQDIARKLGARVVDVTQRGYGAALNYGCREAKGDLIIMGDSDDSYDFSALDQFVTAYNNGYDLIMGNRFKGGIANGAMPWKNRYIGNPSLSFIGKLLFGSKINDFHCGLRAIKKTAFEQLELVTTGMEFASEMVIKAHLKRLSIIEVPTTLSKDGRNRPPHLRPWRDGWRHLKFMLLMAPNWLFLRPALLLFFAALSGILITYNSEIEFFGRRFDAGGFSIFCVTFVISVILLGFWGIVRITGEKLNIFEKKLTNLIQNLAILEIGSVFGLVMVLIATIMVFQPIISWAINEPIINTSSNIKELMLGGSFGLIGIVILFYSFVFGFIISPISTNTNEVQ